MGRGGRLRSECAGRPGWGRWRALIWRGVERRLGRPRPALGLASVANHPGLLQGRPSVVVQPQALPQHFLVM